MGVPYIIYAAFEALNQPVNNVISNSCRQISKQVLCSYCYIIVRSNGAGKIRKGIWKNKLYPK